jgi:DnaJ-domain-containing protein 1
VAAGEAPRSRRRSRRERDLDEIEKRLQDELRRYDERRASEQASGGPVPGAGPGAGAGSGARYASGSAGARSVSGAAVLGLAQHYANLELPVGADWDAVKRAYRRLAAKYHPDRQGGDPEKMRIANELQLRLNQSYQVIKHAVGA